MDGGGMTKTNYFRVITPIVAVATAALVAAGLLALVGTKPAGAAFQGDNGKITFTRDPDDANNEIYVMDPNGSNQTPLTNNGNVYDSNPAFSPSGTKIAFDSNRDGNFNIYMMDAQDDDKDGNGENLTRLTKKTAEDEEPAFSPSGTKIAFASDRNNLGGNYDIYVMKAKPEGRKNRPKNLTKNTPLAFDNEPSFSPDGKKIVFTSDRQDSDGDIYVMNSDGTGVTRLTSDEAFDADASFSPDGTKILFRSGRVVGDNSEVFVMDAVDNDNDGEGDNMTNISNNPDSNDGFPAFSPDGNQIVFRSNPPGEEYEVFIIDVETKDLARLTTNSVADNRPDWGVAPT